MVKQILDARSIRASLLVAAAASALAAQSAQAGVNSPNLVFPPKDSTFIKEPGKIEFPDLAYSITGLSFAPTNNPVALSLPGVTDVSWPTLGDEDFTSAGATGHATMPITSSMTFGADESSSSGAFTFKLVAVKTVSWAHDDKSIRISPTNPSSGELDYTQLVDGSYNMACSIDLNLQLSADGGQTWHDSSSPMRLDLVPTPEPSSMVLIGALPVALLRRRRKFTT